MISINEWSRNKVVPKRLLSMDEQENKVRMNLRWPASSALSISPRSVASDGTKLPSHAISSSSMERTFSCRFSTSAANTCQNNSTYLIPGTTHVNFPILNFLRPITTLQNHYKMPLKIQQGRIQLHMKQCKTFANQPNQCLADIQTFYRTTQWFNAMLHFTSSPQHSIYSVCTILLEKYSQQLNMHNWTYSNCVFLATMR